MAQVVVLGAGLSGTLMAYELVPQLRPDDRLTVIGQGQRYHFVPSNPWVAIGWRERHDIGNVNWSSKGAEPQIPDWVHYAKIAFEKYFLRRIRRGESEPFYERFVLDRLGIRKIKEPA